MAVLAAILCSSSAPDRFLFLGYSVLLGAAVGVLGALIGFLFGIPRAASTTEGRLPYTANTNLEQVSDWLTKILIGVGLAQISGIATAASRLVHYVGPTFGSTPQGEIYVGGLLVYFGVVGFVAGWYPTRVHLGPTLSRSDRQALDLFLAAEAAEEAGQTRRAERLRQSALDLSQEAGRRYEVLRADPPDPKRTAAMEAEVETARRVAMAATLTPEDATAIFGTGKEGDRIWALGLMQGDRRLANFDAACDAIENSRSAFEQLQALRVMSDLASTLTTDQAERLRVVLDGQLGPSGHIHHGSYRWIVAQQIRRSAVTLSES